MSLHTPNAQVSEGFAEMQGLNSDRAMRVETLTWGELSWGVYIVDQAKKCWCVVGRCNGWVRLLDINGDEVSIPPKPLDHPVSVVVRPMDEAVLLVKKTLGATVIKDDFRVARQLLVADRWAVPLMPTTGNKRAMEKIRDHLDWFHSDTWTKDIKTIAELATAHEEMHASIGDMPMSKPHHHTNEVPGGPR